jgi:hypothetical protein
MSVLHPEVTRLMDVVRGEGGSMPYADLQRHFSRATSPAIIDSLRGVLSFELRNMDGSLVHVVSIRPVAEGEAR